MQKEGLGVNWEDFEQNRYVVKPKSFYDLVQLLVKSKNPPNQQKDTSRGMKLWNRFKDIINEGRRINVDVKGISRQKLSVPTLKYEIKPYFSKSKKFVLMYKQMEYDTKVLENEVRRYRDQQTKATSGKLSLLEYSTRMTSKELERETRKGLKIKHSESLKVDKYKRRKNLMSDLLFEPPLTEQLDYKQMDRKNNQS